MSVILQMTFTNAFIFNEEIWILIKILLFTHALLYFEAKSEIDAKSALVQIRHWHQIGAMTKNNDSILHY